MNTTAIKIIKKFNITNNIFFYKIHISHRIFFVFFILIPYLHIFWQHKSFIFYAIYIIEIRKLYYLR